MEDCKEAGHTTSEGARSAAVVYRKDGCGDLRAPPPTLPRRGLAAMAGVYAPREWGKHNPMPRNITSITEMSGLSLAEMAPGSRGRY